MDTHISSLVDELDFEDENAPIHEEELSKMKETHPSLLEELIYDVNDTMLVKEKIPDALKVSMPKVCVLGELQQSDMREKESEKVVDFEEGEISDSDSNKKSDNTVCKFFERGTCFYGSQCQFLHISNKIYNMFDPISSYEKNLKIVAPCYFPSTIENPLNLMEGNKNAWEKGLENAKAMIQKAICKRIGDKEFENKKMYISSDSSNLNIPLERGHVLKSMEKQELNPYQNTKPLHTNSLRRDKSKKENARTYKSNCYYVEKSNHELKWVDPWMRSRSPRKRKNFKPYSKQDYCRELSRSSSSSSIENTYRGSPGNKFYKRKSPACLLNIRCCRSRSYSRSASRSFSSRRSWSCSSCRSRSSSDSFHSSYNKRIKKSTSYKVSPAAKRKSKKRRSTSLEKWFKRKHQIGSASQSSSRSNIHLIHKSANSISSHNSSNESCDCMTVSSITCSCSSSSSNSPTNYSKSNVINKISKAARKTTETKNGRHFQSKKLSISQAGKSASKESTNKNLFGKVSSTLVTINMSSDINKDTTSQRVTSPKAVLKLPSKPILSKESAKDNFSSTVNTLLRYRSISNNFNSNQTTVSKSKNPVINSTTTLQSIETSQTPDKKKAPNFLPKRIIILNLQPKTQKLIKLSEIANRNPDQPVTVCKVEETSLSKRELLLKQLKLIEDAIAKKKGQ